MQFATRSYCRRAAVTALLLLVGLGSGRAAAQPLAWTSPAGGETWTAGTTHMVHWTGGSLSATINAQVIDMNTFAVVGNVVLGIANVGQVLWNIPANLPPGSYQLYVEELPLLSWAYSSTFTIQGPPVCAPSCTLASLGMPALVCGTTETEANALATQLALAQLGALCPAGSTLDSNSVLVDLTLVALGGFPCPTGYIGAYAVEASAVGCCCLDAVAVESVPWKQVKTMYR